ncbi:MAG: hypothetical protein KatS3mg076_2183 [Candidatus Binatia bacterium]|nr:MAG: hypothetical protein KatS3mg076_2183 [Candidatus Binatia bacterium]
MGEFRLVMISAMYENGGNVVHRHLDGHPQLFVYPFESQLGTHWVTDALASMFPAKYRWPVFPLEGTPEEDFRSIVDEETRVRARTPYVSKFRSVPFEFDDEERGRLYARYVRENGRSRAENVRAFFRATFDAWRNFRRTDEQSVYVGYSPAVVVDTPAILADFPDAHVVHVVRNPWSAYADTKKRPVPLSLDRYMATWCLVQQHATAFERMYPGRVHLLRYEDVVREPEVVLGSLCRKMGLRPDESLRRPSWNGEPLEEVFPWGTIRKATPETNEATARELSLQERERITAWAAPWLGKFGYEDFLGDAER